MQGEPLRILLVEDEAAHAELVRRAFAVGAGAVSLSTASNLQEARAKLAEAAPDLLIADLILPDGRGTELLPKAGEDRSFPVVMMTAHGDQEMAVAAMKAGALDYVVKSEATFADMPHIAERALREWGHVREQKKLEKQLRHFEKMEAIGQLAGGVAHDFNNQLGAILGYAELLRDHLKDNERLRRYADTIVQSAKHSADLTRQLLAFSRQGKYRSEPVDIHQTIKQVVSLLERSIDKRITIKKILTAKQAVTSGDPTQLENAFLNIAINARDAMPTGGALAFTTETAAIEAGSAHERLLGLVPGRYLQVSISDTGIGMDAETQKHIFEPFFTTKGIGEGAGMGLAGAYGTFKNHQGAVGVYSEPGRGSIFKVYLPLSEAAGKKIDLSAAIPAIKGTGHVLIADDEEVMRSAAADILLSLGYEVTCRNDGTEAMEYYRKAWRHIDLVILDLIMPGLNGCDTFHAMKEVNPQVKAIISSGYGLDDDIQKTLEDGAAAFVQKPFRLAELSQAVAKVLGGKRTD